MRVVTINTWNGVSMRNLGPRPIEPPENKGRRSEVLIAQLRELDADVVLLQECVPDPRFSRMLAAELAMAHHNQVNNGGVRLFGVGIPMGIGAGEGLAILSKASLEPAPVRSRKLLGVGATNNIASLQLSGMYYGMAVRIRVGEQSITVVNTHLPYTFPDIAGLERAWEALASEADTTVPPAMKTRVTRKIARRSRSVRRLRDWVRQLASAGPVIVGGDFNLDPDHADVIAFTSDLDLVNVLPSSDPEARTWDPTRNRNVDFSTTMSWHGGEPKGLARKLVAQFDLEHQCPDHLMVSAALAPSVTGSGIAFVDPMDGVQASDHFGVWLDLAL